MKVFAKLDHQLIRLVKENKVLYDTTHIKYTDHNEREVVWQKIGDQLKRPANECKSRWVNIRDINRRILRKSILHPELKTKLYKYHDDMSFMRPFYRDILLQQNEEEEQIEEMNEQDFNDADPDEESVADDPLTNQSNEESDIDQIDVKHFQLPDNHEFSAPPTKKNKRKRGSSNKKDKVSPDNSVNLLSELDPSDTLDAFLMSIGATLKKFTPYHLNQAKSKIFNIVQEHELEQIMTKKRKHR